MKAGVFAGMGTVMALLLGVGVWYATKDEEGEEPGPAPGPNGIPPRPPLPKPKPPVVVTPTIPTKPKKPPRPAPKPEPSPQPPPKKPKTENGLPGLPKFSKAGGAERRNAAFAVNARPKTFKAKDGTVRKKSDKQKARFWLADVTYWNTYPKGPVKIDPTNPAHEGYAKAWTRILGHVDRMLKIWPALRKTNPILPDSPFENTHANWRRWALAMAVSSAIRSPAGLASAYRASFNWIMRDPDGKKWFRKWHKKKIRGLTATEDALQGEAAYIMDTAPAGRHGTIAAFNAWTGKKPSKAFMATRKTAVN